MTPERRNRLRALGKTGVATSPAVRDGGHRDANVTRVTRVTRAYDQPGSAASLPETGNVSSGVRLNQVDQWAEVEERAAMAQHGGGFPANFALAFARLQLERPPHVDQETWDGLMDTIGRLLDGARDLATTGVVADLDHEP